MGKKRVCEQNIRKHTKELEESITLITPGLIEAFVSVYGEKYRDKITSTITNMKYIFFISESFCDILSSPKGVRKRNIYLMNSYIKYLRKQDYRFNFVAPEDQEQFIVKNYLSKYPFRVEDYSTFADALATDCPCCSAALYETKDESYAEFYICLPIFTINLKTIIHEINHALNINIIGCTEEALIMQTMFEQKDSEELVNDYIASLVEKEYRSWGGGIPRALRSVDVGNEYEYKDYIVTYLFECLEPLLLESRISGNYNLFYELVGLENVRQLENLMSLLYNKEYFDEELYNELISLIDEIYEKVINTNPINAEEKINELEKLGYTIRRLKKKED